MFGIPGIDTLVLTICEFVVDENKLIVVTLYMHQPIWQGVYVYHYTNAVLRLFVMVYANFGSGQPESNG